MATARAMHTASALPNGRILVAGGVDSPSAELYDPATGTWSATGSMAMPHARHTASVLPTGRILVAGGYSPYGGPSFQSAELYDPVTGTWTDTGSMVIARQDHTASVLPDGKILVAGGRGGHAQTPAFSSAEVYDPGTGTWTATGDLNVPRHGYTASVLPDGKVLAAGGDYGSGGTSAEVYDPATGLWTLTGSMTANCWGHAAGALLNGMILVHGGWQGPTELYDAATGTWIATGSALFRRFLTVSVLPDGKVLAVGGYDGWGGLPDPEIYDPTTGTWSGAGSMVKRRAYHTASVLPNGAVLVAGGVGAYDKALADAELFRMKHNGSVCIEPEECISGFCVDSVCCDTACGGGISGDCQACNFSPGAPENGTCRPLTGGACTLGCSNPEKPDGAACSGGVCTAGVCVPGPSITPRPSEASGSSGCMSSTEAPTGGFGAAIVLGLLFVRRQSRYSRRGASCRA